MFCPPILIAVLASSPAAPQSVGAITQMSISKASNPGFEVNRWIDKVTLSKKVPLVFNPSLP
ncbi:hypothetical protein EON82_12450 [bacterium]|nr:MAG: hypothetical protein EON82_12450 [bacterium]